MIPYTLRPQDPVPASIPAEQLAQWYAELSNCLRFVKVKRKNVPFMSKADQHADYLIFRYKHDLKKIREAAAARSFASFGIDLSQFKGISYAD